MLARILNLLFPPKCVLCGALLERHQTDFCESCRTQSRLCPGVHHSMSFLDSWLSVWYYEGYIRSSILRYKFGRRRLYAAAYGRVLALRIRQEHSGEFDVLTWVPVSRFRKWGRGFDQGELLANAVGRELGMCPVRTLRKTRNNRPQSGIAGEAKRRANVMGVYRCVDPKAISGKRILILDDVITTGATVGECARVLKTAGAKEVHCGTVAAASHHK